MKDQTDRNEARGTKLALAWACLAAALFVMNAENAWAQTDAELLKQGKSHHEAKHYDDAIASFERLIQLYPNSSYRNEAELFAGHSYMLRNQYTNVTDANSAQRHFNFLLDQGVNAQYYKEAFFHTAHLAYDMREYQDSRTRLINFLNQYANDDYVPFALYYLANCEAKLNDYATAIKRYEQAINNQYLKSSDLRWNCLLERATLIGKLGDYQTAESELTKLDRELANYASQSTSQSPPPTDVAGQVAVQRALLQFVQQNYSQAIVVLDSYIKRFQTYENDQFASDAILTAYLYEAYAYYALKDYQRAINVIETVFESNKSALPPEPALLKIKLLLAVNRVADAEALLTNFANSTFGQQCPDVVTSYSGLVDLMKGNYDSAIQRLTKLLDVRRVNAYAAAYLNETYAQNAYGSVNPYGSNPTYGSNLTTGTNSTNASNPTYGGVEPYAPTTGTSYTAGYSQNNQNAAPAFKVTIGYLSHTGGQYLDPLDCVEACETLVLAYASRYALTHVQEDYDYQDAIYRETVNYANWAKEPTIALLVQSANKRRADALVTPVSSANSSPTYIVAPYAANGYNVTPGQFSDPTKFNTYSRPDYFMYGSTNREYRPNDYYTNKNYRWHNWENPNRYDSSDPNGYDRQNSSNSRYNPNAPNNNGNRTSNNPDDPYYVGNNNSNYGPNGAPNNQNNQNNQNGQNNQNNPNNSQNAQNQNQQNPNGNQDPNAKVGPDGKPLGPDGKPLAEDANGKDEKKDAEQEEKHITPTEAQKTLDKATVFYRNQEFDRCNETLLELLTSSETFWLDCPGVAPKIALLRGNALVPLGKSSEAQMSYQNVLDNAPNSPEAVIAATYIGLNYDRLGRSEEAVKYLRRATASGAVTPLSDAALYYLGMNERERGNIQNAKQAFARIHRDYQSSAYWSHATWALAQIEADQRNDKKAEYLVNEALSSKPDAAIVDYLLFLKGEIALRAKDYVKALIAFDMIIDQYPDSDLYAKAKNRLAAVPEKYRGEELFEEVPEEEYEPRRVPLNTQAAPNAQDTRQIQQTRPAQETAQETAKSPARSTRPAAPASDPLNEFDPEASRRVPVRETKELPKATPGTAPKNSTKTSEPAQSERSSGRSADASSKKTAYNDLPPDPELDDGEPVSSEYIPANAGAKTQKKKTPILSSLFPSRRM